MSTKKRSQSDDGPSKKKVRFEGNRAGTGSFGIGVGQVDDETEDFEDLELGRKKRNAIKLGYTDSDDEDLAFDTEAPKDEDEDMFGESDDKGPGKAAGKGKKGSVEYISRQKIYEEGAERNDDVDEDEGGVKIEQFNMDQELEEGLFGSSTGTVSTPTSTTSAKRTNTKLHDNWLQGVTKDDMNKARAKAKEAMDEVGKQESEGVLWLRVLGFLKQKESVAGVSDESLGSSTTKVPAWKKKKAAAKMETSTEPEEDHSKELEQLIAATDSLIENGHYEVIEQRYESIVRLLRKRVLSDDWNPGDPLPTAPSSSSTTTSPKTFWEYKWAKNRPNYLDLTQGFFDAEKGDLWSSQPHNLVFHLHCAATTTAAAEEDLKSIAVMVAMAASPSMSKVYYPTNIYAKYLNDDVAEDFYSAFDPSQSDFCMSQYCVGPGMLINTILQVCNATIQSISPSLPPTASDVKKLLSKCICGTTGSESGSVGARSEILASWFVCANCYREFYQMKTLNQTEFNRACDCIEPGPIDALMAFSRPQEEFTCKKVRRTNRGPVAPPQPSQGKAPTQATTAGATTGVPLATTTQAPRSTNEAEAVPEEEEEV
ncbi:hypothetical protein BC829DRAFT_486905 [Chytridium lagenaria]|nr:hypothetical protein BC829DRAFT_486905 [Chytridium lagenaria]